VVGRPLPSNRHDSRGWEESGTKDAAGKTMTIADGGYQGTDLVIPHRRTKGKDLPASPKGDGVRYAMLGIARLHNLNLAG
jgi:hypothetical protein